MIRSGKTLHTNAACFPPPVFPCPGQFTHSSASQHVYSNQMHKIEMPNEDVIVEVVINISPDNPSDLATASSPATTDKKLAMSNNIDQTSEIVKDPDNPLITPSVTVSRTGRSLFIEERGPVSGDSGGGAGGSGRLGRLTFPQPIMPESIKSFFWEGDLTIRAVLAVES